MSATERGRMPFWRGVFYLILAAGMVTTYIRFRYGLGSVTNLSDKYPWGLWVGFDLLCGVGLAAGGFVITAIVYIFNIESWRPVARPAVLTAFLGYILVGTALLFDLGRPWNIWHPLIMWNPHSVMFEVAWCVMLYSTVLALEFSGLVFEKFGWKRAVKVQHTLSIPLVIAGVVLSTLHQSSLGTVYLIVPGKLHPLWYTSLLPVLFWISAAAVGLAMVIVESKLAARALGHHLERPLLTSVGRALVGVLGLYGVIRIFDLATRGQMGAVFAFDYESIMFLIEFVLGVLLPIVILGSARRRRSVKWLYAGALFAVLGFVTHRLNVGLTGLEAAQGGHYIPALGEVIITVMMVAIGFAVFYVVARNFPVYPDYDETPKKGRKTPSEIPVAYGEDEAAPWASRVLARR